MAIVPIIKCNNQACIWRELEVGYEISFCTAEVIEHNIYGQCITCERKPDSEEPFPEELNWKL